MVVEGLLQLGVYYSLLKSIEDGREWEWRENDESERKKKNWKGSENWKRIMKREMPFLKSLELYIW